MTPSLLIAPAMPPSHLVTHHHTCRPHTSSHINTHAALIPLLACHFTPETASHLILPPTCSHLILHATNLPLLTPNTACHQLAPAHTCLPACLPASLLLPARLPACYCLLLPACLPATACYCLRYKEDLGNALVNYARLVPDGLLVFFPSYTGTEGASHHTTCGCT